MKEELIAGIRNALERGESLDQAVRSFINAGYHANDVNEAAGTFSGAMNIVAQPTRPIEISEPKPGTNIPLPEIKAEPNKPIYPKRQSNYGWIVALIIILLVLLGILGASVMFKDQILTFVKNFGA